MWIVTNFSDTVRAINLRDVWNVYAEEDLDNGGWWLMGGRPSPEHDEVLAGPFSTEVMAHNALGVVMKQLASAGAAVSFLGIAGSTDD